MRSRNRLPVAPATHPPQQRLADTCCSERSKYGTPAAQIASIRPSVRSLGYRYSNRTRSTSRRRPVPPAARSSRRPSSSGRSLPYEARSWATSTISRGFERSTSVEDRLDVAAALRAAETRDRAEPAGAVAALGDLHVGPRHRRLRAWQVEQVELGQRRRRHRDQLALSFGTPVPSRSRHHVERLPEPGDLVDLGERSAPARRRSARPCSR